MHTYNNSAIVLIVLLWLFSFWRLAFLSSCFWTIFILAKCSAKKPRSWQPMAASPLVHKQIVLDANLLRVFPFIRVFSKKNRSDLCFSCFPHLFFSKKNRVVLSFSWFFVHFLYSLCYFEDVSLVEFTYPVLIACQVELSWGCLLGGVYVPCINRMPGGIIVGDSGLCCCVPFESVTSFEPN